MRENIKIAIYSGEIPSTTFIERLIHELSKKGNKIYLFGKQNKSVKKERNIYYVTYSNRLSKIFTLLKYTLLLFLFNPKEKKALDKIISKKTKNTNHLKIKYYPVLYHKPDIFHIQWAKSLADWIWLKEFEIKLVLSLRGAHINYSPIADKTLAKQYSMLFPKVDKFHAVSKAIANEATKYDAPLNKIKVVYSGLDLKNIKFHNKKYNNKSPLKIISVGRSHWIKGYAYALKSMHLLKKMGVDFQYTIVGVTNSEELLYQRWQLGLENEVHFVTSLPFSKVLKKIQSADVLLLSSLKEGIANVVLESMALGTLVISTNCGGMQEVLTTDINGFLVPIRNPEAMATVLKEVANLSDKKYQQITKTARKTIIEQHDINKTLCDMQDLYNEVLKN